MIYPLPTSNAGYPEPVYFWEDFLTDRELHTILSYPNWDSLVKARVGDSNLEINKTRCSEVSFLEASIETAWLFDKLATVIATVNAKNFRFDLDGLSEGIQLGLYSGKDEGHYDWHIDSGGGAVTSTIRKLSFSLLLSNPSEFEGGRFEVKTESDNPIELEQKRGRAWLFPSHILHRVTPVTKGERKSLVIWVSGPQFR